MLQARPWLPCSESVPDTLPVKMFLSGIAQTAHAHEIRLTGILDDAGDVNMFGEALDRIDRAHLCVPPYPPPYLA
jgi:hypothetical protein